MLDLPVTLAGLFVGLVVGMTGMGGGALMTPLLMLFFGMEPLAAVSSDLVASMFMKPVGAAVHLKRKSVHRDLVLWLVLGSVPSAFVGVLLTTQYGGGEYLQELIKVALGGALLVVVLALIARPLIARARANVEAPAGLRVRPVPTLLVGIAGGLIVGLTSVGSGSLMIMMLLMLYPTIRLSDLVGTDLVQAVPLVASAALAHFVFGDFRASVTASILVGSIPGIYLGARFSSRASDRAIRPLLAVVLTATGLKLLGASNWLVAGICGSMALGSVMHHNLFAARRADAATEG